MQELEKILEEIDEIKVGFDTECRSECDLYDWSCGACVGECDEYIKERAKDIIRKHMNDGWIPVEERLPTKEECEKDNNEFLVQTNTGERFSCEYDPLSNGYDNPLWCCNVPVVAWQSLPEPYRSERSDNHDGE